MKRTCLIPSVTALACADTAAPVGYIAAPPHMDLWEELAEVQLCSRILRSDRKLNFSCHETLAPLPATLKVEHGMAAPSMAAAAVSVAASQRGGCGFDSSSGLFQLFKSQRWTGGVKAKC